MTLQKLIKDAMIDYAYHTRATADLVDAREANASESELERLRGDADTAQRLLTQSLADLKSAGLEIDLCSYLQR